MTQLHRLEPDSRATDLRRGATLPVADAAWILGRQWWVGEWAAHDGGAPVMGVAAHDWLGLNPSGAGAPRDPEGLVPSSLLAAPVAAADWRARLRAGRPVLRILEAEVAALVRQIEALPDISGNLREMLGAVRRRLAETVARHRIAGDGLALRRVPEARRLDGIALAEAFARGQEPWLSQTGAAPLLRDILRTARGADFAAETGRHTARVPAGETFDDAVRVVDAPGPRLDWSDVEGPERPASARSGETSALLSRLTLAGDPPEAWWRVEEAAQAWSAAPAGPSDLGQLLLSAALSHQERLFWILPLAAPTGGLLRVRSVTLRDGFGREVAASPRAPAGRGSWTDGTSAGWLPILAEGPHLTGTDVSLVVFAADPAENLVMAEERRAPDASGEGHLLRPPPTPRESSGLALRVPPPENWYPYLPEQGELTLAPLSRPGGVVRPSAELLPDRLHLPGAAIGPEGWALGAGWRLARAPNGARVLWLARGARQARITGSSGFAHDVELRPDPGT